MLAGAVALLATLPLQADDTWKLQPLRYNNPGLEVDLGVGLWAWPLPMDYDDDGDRRPSQIPQLTHSQKYI